MAHKLPDEILVEILAPVLEVDDKSFADMGALSPFSLRDYSNSSIIVVCKQWLRVATPLLYHVVILRSTAQAQALAVALKKNHQLGQFIRKLRLEGGFGASIEKIMLAAPKITDLFLSLSIWSNDSTVGLLHGLPFLNPSCLIVKHAGRMRNRQTRRLRDTICECMKLWSNMKIFQFSSFPELPGPFPAEILRNSQTIEILRVSEYDFASFNLGIADIPPSLKVVEVITNGPSPSFQTMSHVHPKLQELARYKSSPRPDVFVPKLPSFHGFSSNALPMINSGVPSVTSIIPPIQDGIWSRILEFAMEPVFSITPHKRTYIRTGRALFPLVSKQFHRLSIPHLYSHLVITRHEALRLLADRLISNPSLALFIRFISAIAWDGQHPGVMKAAHDILSMTTSLIRFCGIDTQLHGICRMDWESFSILARTSGSTLLSFHDIVVVSQSLPQSPSVLNSFISLSFLRWRSNIEFDINPDLISSAALPALKSVHFLLCHTSFFQLLSYLELPSLSSVVFYYYVPDAFHFLFLHGTKIRELTFLGFENLPSRITDVCPNVTLLTLGDSSWLSKLNPSILHSLKPNRSLAKIKLHVVVNSSIEGGSFFANLDPGNCLGLVEIQCTACEWPKNEREIAKDYWHKWAEKLLKWGIKLTDSQGRHWRPRLKRQRET